ncbi:MAG: hypothetical protein ACD_78C00070G0001 [uncultured bacterium (gcode 4)]|uniref:Uncharacterized protein n=1 Tax=uncultured bacterium (gcode 4) TaxID=1234023 RepID=K1XJ41_9BACT|nr:MAG: hypothetical protein ACD_78C00070G0001 [uncultured bacterium (gcode 4)]
MIDKFHSFLHSSEYDIETKEHKGKKCSNDDWKYYENNIENKLGIHKNRN